MPVEISETRPDEFDAVLSFCGFTDQTGPSEARPFLSLTAQDGDQLVGALVCGPHSDTDRSKQITVRGTDAEHSLAARLVGKAVVKLHSLGVRQCRIAVRQPSQEKNADDSACGFWESVIWSARPDLGDAQHVVRVMGRH